MFQLFLQAGATCPPSFNLLFVLPLATLLTNKDSITVLLRDVPQTVTHILEKPLHIKVLNCLEFFLN